MTAAARNDHDVSSGQARAAMSKRIFTGLKPRHLGRIVAGLADPWLAAEESRLLDRRGRERGPGS
jgi:hypothetical protein